MKMQTLSCLCFDAPHTSILLALLLIVPLRIWPIFATSKRLKTAMLGPLVEALSSVVVTELYVVCEDSHISPGGGMPVGVIVSLLGAFVATAIAVGVLSGVDSRAHAKSVLSKLLVSRKES